MEQTTSSVDLLSFLPNELLDIIFDHAYPLELPSTGPLSKRLLPWHIDGLYKRIQAGGEMDVAKLISKINEEPRLGSKVEILELSAYDSAMSLHPISPIEIKNFFRNLSRLQEVRVMERLGGIFEEESDLIEVLSPGYLPTLRHLTIPAWFMLQEFATCSQLVSLKITEYGFNRTPMDDNAPATLARLTSLSVEGAYADDVALGSFCSLCPSLRHLRLQAFQPSYEQIMLRASRDLSRLELLRTDESNAVSHLDQLLPRFSQLQELVLGDRSFSPDLPSYLTGINTLHTIELGDGRISVDKFIPLISGPNRLLLLRRLKLDLVRGKVGYRLFVDEDGYVGGRWVPGGGKLTAGDWICPAFDQDGGFTAQKVRNLIQVARDEGIEVEGSILQALEVHESYLLEIANLAVYRSYRDETFEPIITLQEKHSHLSERLPSLSLDTLDPSELKLVKTELPEEGWFSLTLETRGERALEGV